MAFSLVDIMVAVGIAGILTSLAIVAIQQYLYKARQSEAAKNLDVITGMYVAELGSDAASIPETSSETVLVDPGTAPAYTNDFNQPNFLGFALTEKPRYRYSMYHGRVSCSEGAGTVDYVVIAIAQSRRIGCDNEPSDVIWKGVTLTDRKSVV